MPDSLLLVLLATGLAAVALLPTNRAQRARLATAKDAVGDALTHADTKPASGRGLIGAALDLHLAPRRARHGKELRLYRNLRDLADEHGLSLCVAPRLESLLAILGDVKGRRARVARRLMARARIDFAMVDDDMAPRLLVVQPGRGRARTAIAAAAANRAVLPLLRADGSERMEDLAAAVDALLQAHDS